MTLIKAVHMSHDRKKIWGLEQQELVNNDIFGFHQKIQFK